jgi:hypothetical protein
MFYHIYAMDIPLALPHTRPRTKTARSAQIELAAAIAAAKATPSTQTAHSAADTFKKAAPSTQTANFLKTRGRVTY